MANSRKKVEYTIRLPKEIKIDSLDVKSIPIDENWITTVREDHRNIGQMPLKLARQKGM